MESTVLLPRLRAALLNTVTDSAFLFSLGSAILVAPVSKTACVVNVGRAVLCLGTRLVTEFGNAAVSLPVPKFFRTFAANRGASLMTSGIITYGSMVVAAARIDPAVPETMIPALSLGLFATGNLANGLSVSMPDKGFLKATMNAVGMMAANAGMAVAAGPEIPLLIYSLFAASALSATALAARRETAGGLLQPERYAAAGCLAAAFNAFATGGTVYGVASLCSAAGMLTLDCLKRHGGVSQAFERQYNKQAPEPKNR